MKTARSISVMELQIKDPFSLAIFAAISNPPCKLLAIPRRFESPVVYDRREIALEIAAKIVSINGP